MLGSEITRLIITKYRLFQLMQDGEVTKNHRDLADLCMDTYNRIEREIKRLSDQGKTSGADDMNDKDQH
jgi:hypothetical protein